MQAVLSIQDGRVSLRFCYRFLNIEAGREAPLLIVWLQGARVSEAA